MSYKTTTAQKVIELFEQINQPPVSKKTGEIVDALAASKGVFLDAHRRGSPRAHHHFVVVEMAKGQFVAPTHTDGEGRWACTLNPITLQGDGSLMLSTCAKHMLDYRHCYGLLALADAFNEQWENASHCQAKIIHTFEV